MGQYDQGVTVLSVLFMDTTGKESRTTKGVASSEETTMGEMRSPRWGGGESKQRRCEKAVATSHQPDADRAGQRAHVAGKL